MDILQGLKPGCRIKREDGSSIWVKLRYERLSDFCYSCGRIDHTQTACPCPQPVDPNPSQSDEQCGPWMRTSSAGTPKLQKNPPLLSPTATSPTSETTQFTKSTNPPASGTLSDTYDPLTAPQLSCPAVPSIGRTPLQNNSNLPPLISNTLKTSTPSSCYPDDHTTSKENSSPSQINSQFPCCL